jgi:branched-subunit amino acid ABC-type transport system permease component
VENGTQRVPVVALVAIVSVEDAPVLLVAVVDVAVVLVAAVSVVLVPVALAPVDDTPVSTAAVSVFALLSLLQPMTNTATTSRTATNDLFIRRDSLTMISGGVTRKDERSPLNERL